MEKRPKLKSSHGRAAAPPAKGGKKLTPKEPAKKGKPSRGKGLPASFVRKPEAAAPRDAQKPKRLPKPANGEVASTASDEAREVAVHIALAALDRKAVGLEIIDVAGRVDYADFLILMSGRSDRQVSALSQAIEEALKRKLNRRPVSIEGLPHAVWVLMDYSDVVVHVFQEEARGTYDLDGLFNDARRVPVPVVND